MLRRIFVLLLALGLMLPMVAPQAARAEQASGHCAPVMTHAGHDARDDGREAPAPLTTKHICIGCAATLSGPGEQIAGPELREPLPQELAIAGLVSLGSHPDTPPPRG